MNIEPLEPRIAPATVVNATTITFTDADGDDVTVKITKGSFDPGGAEFTFDTAFGTAAPQQLQLLDLSAAEFAGTNITITAKRSAVNGGDGFVNVGFIDARDGVEDIDLGSVTIDGDLGGLDAGDADLTTASLKSLAAQSLGAFGLATQGGSGDLTIRGNGTIGKIAVKGDVRTSVQLAGGAGANLGPVTIGGSLFGGTGFQSGTLEVVGNIGPVKIGGSLLGGAGNLSGGISANGTIASVTIGGSLEGGSALQSGEISAGGDIGPVKIGRDLRGGGGANDAGRIVSTGGAIKSLSIGGSVLGGGADFVGGGAQIFAGTTLGPVSIGGDLRGGAGDGTAALRADVIVSVKLRGSLLGGAGSNSGQIFTSTGDLGPVTIGGSFEAGPGINGGTILASGAIKSVSIGGSWLRTGGGDSRIFSSDGGIGVVKIAGDLRSGGGQFALGTGGGGDLGPITIGGSVLGGAAGQPLFAPDGAIKALTVKGSVVGTAAFPVIVLATDSVTASGKIAIGGRAEFAIFTSTDRDSVIGAIVIGGDFIASRIAAGTDDGADNIRGTADDTFFGGGDPAKLSTLVSLTIKGMAYGTVGGTDSFRIMAEKIGKITIGGTALPLPAGPGTTPIGITGDLAAHDLVV